MKSVLRESDVDAIPETCVSKVDSPVFLLFFFFCFRAFLVGRSLPRTGIKRGIPRGRIPSRPADTENCLKGGKLLPLWEDGFDEIPI